MFSDERLYFMEKLAQEIVEKTLGITGKDNIELARQFAERFFNELKEGVMNIPTHAEEGASSSLAMTLHKLAGACAYFGAIALHRELLAGECSVKANDIAKLSLQLTNIHVMLKEAIAQESSVLNYFSQR